MDSSDTQKIVAWVLGCTAGKIQIFPGIKGQIKSE